MGASSSPTRRQIVQAMALATGASLAAPYVKAANSAGRLKLGLWDHWVPGANDVVRQIVEEWGKAAHVEVQVDFIGEVEIVAAAEARAGAGHDIIALWDRDVATYADRLEPLDEAVDALTTESGPFLQIATRLARHDGTWHAIGAPTGSHTYPLACRLDLWQAHAGLDPKAMFPAGSRDAGLVENWDYAAFLEACKALHAAGHPFGNPISTAADAQDWLGPLFLAFGSELVSADGDITVDSDSTRAALDYLLELTRYMPEDVYAWDAASNNRWLLSGKGSAIINPPSAWAVAKRDQPDVAAQIWHHDLPRGSHGRYRAMLPLFWGVWSFSEEKSAAKERHLSSAFH